MHGQAAHDGIKIRRNIPDRQWTPPGVCDMKRALVFRPFCLVILLLLAVTCVGAHAQKPPARKRTAAAPAPPSRQETRLKAIFEPVSYPDDLQLFDVFFVNQNIGWAVGGKNRAGGGALYTSDGWVPLTSYLSESQSTA